jgi:hypothetical protein
VSINAYPPLRTNSTEADYIQVSSTSYPELDNNSIVDLIERYDVDVVYRVFPNPFFYSLTIETPNNESVQVRMFDMSGPAGI